MTISRISYQNARTYVFARNLNIKVKTLFLLMKRLPYNAISNIYLFSLTYKP